jgi:signal transduction histidine kinase
VSRADRRKGERRRSGDGATEAPRYDRLVTQALHDARQQAATINALAKLAQDGNVSEEALRHLTASAQHLAGLLERIWERETDVRLVTVWPAVEDVVAAARLTAGATVEVDVDKTAAILADASLLRRATANLVDNAIRAAGDGGVVRFRLARDGGRTTLEVEDSGPGFGAVPAGKGAVGLAVVAEFVTSVGGTIELHPSQLGGTLLRVSVPDRAEDHVQGGKRESSAV